MGLFNWFFFVIVLLLSAKPLWIIDFCVANERRLSVAFLVLLHCIAKTKNIYMEDVMNKYYPSEGTNIAICRGSEDKERPAGATASQPRLKNIKKLW